LLENPTRRALRPDFNGGVAIGMKLGTFAFAAGTLALGLALWTTPGGAQGPMWDRVNVSLPYTVTIGEKTLQPGDYVIQQLRDSGGGGRILLVYSDKGMKFETSAMSIPALDINTARDTKVVLHHFGNDYYLDKVWIQGKDYGYEFPLPNSIKEREKERMAAVTVPAQYSSVAAEDTTATTSASATTAQTPQTDTVAEQQRETIAQQTPPDTPAVAVPITATPEPAPTTARSEPTPAPATMAPENESNTANRAMPETSAGWLMMLLGGGTLSGAGMVLRRKR